MIEVEHVTRYFGRTTAVDDVSFEVKKGEILGFLGPNAAGKTTTMRILTTYLPATNGTARVAGFDVREQSMEVRKRIGYLPEHPPLYDDMSTRSYLDFVAKIKGVVPKNRTKKVAEIMDRVAITNVAEKTIKNLSKGYKQRVGLAQALVHDPEVLILDEPTIGLDPVQIIEVRELIKSLAGDHTIILSTHILPEVSMTCDRVVIIDKGKVIAEDTPEKLTASLKGSEKLALEVRGPKEEIQNKLRSIAGVKKITIHSGGDDKVIYNIESELNVDVRPELAKAVVQNNWELFEMRPVGMSLEDVFLQLTTTEKEVQA